MKIATELDEYEVETLAHLLKSTILEHREMSSLRHAAKEITDEVHGWNLGHADHVLAIAKKLFPGFRD